MTATLETSFNIVQELAKTFEDNKQAYLGPDYSEAQARKDFVDKFFIALGWDVNHDIQKNPYEQEVKVEPPVAVGGTQRHADYGFRLSPNLNNVRFFVEAKKPSAAIRTKENYFQVIRYGWNSQTPLAVLTDFQDFHVLDCRYKPDPDTALNRAVATYNFTEYSDKEKFARIYWLFSREAVAAGSLEKRAAELPKPHGKSLQRGLFPGSYKPVDESFLEELDEFRTDLARAFKDAEHDLNSETLTELTQRTLDRLVFLRFLEDKGIEIKALVDKFGDRGTVWEDFIAASRRLDGIYNGIVFRQHAVLDSSTFSVEDTVFGGICERLASVNTPYDFNSIPIHILGSIYERFLGKVIVTTAKRVRVEEKPEVRKAGGVYYTPEYISRYIVQNTVGKLIAGRTPAEIAEMRFADIACGSGSFLLSVYDLLLQYHGNYYNTLPPPENARSIKRGDCIERDGKIYLSLRKKREILLNNIYGVDIDAQAVEVTQLSLFLRLLQDETPVSTHQYQLDFQQVAQMKKVLPDLSKNVVCGNSLIGSDILNGHLFVAEVERKLNPMNFEDAFPEVMKRGGFEAIVGNPPYGMVVDPIQKSHFGERFTTTEGRFDTFELFIERATKLCREGGRVGYIVPSPLLSNLYARRLRRYLLDNSSLEEITNFGLNVFADPTIHTCIIILSRGRRPGSMVKVRKQVMSQEALHNAHDYEIPQEHLGANTNFVFDVFFDPQASSLLDKLSGACQPLGEAFFIRQCIKTGNDRKFVQSSDRSPGRQWKPSLRGKSIERYCICERNLFVKYGPWLARNWANKTFYETPKIAIRETGSRITATLDLENRYFLSSLYSIYPKLSTDPLSLHYLLGILNSSLATYFVKKVALELTKGAFTKIRTNQLARLPIRGIDFSDRPENQKYHQVIEKVEAILEAKRDLASSKTDKDKTYYENKCASLDRQIDRLVYDLYGLTEDEIKLIEGSDNKNVTSRRVKKGREISQEQEEIF